MARLVCIVIAFLRLGTLTAFGVIVFAVLLQVFSRTFLSASPVWTEELTRMALLFLAAFGAALAYRSGDLVSVDIMTDALPERAARIVRLISAGATSAFCAVLIGPARDFMGIGRMQTSPALALRMDVVHASVLVLLVALCLMSGLRVVAILAGWSDGRAETSAGR